MINKTKNIAYLIIFLMSFGLINLSIQNISSAQQAKPSDNEPVQPMKTCYAPAVDPTYLQERTKEDLNKQLETLEDQYKERKISYKTYKSSKKNILDELKKLEKKSKK